AALAYEYASAGDHLDRFRAWLVENTNYDVDATDWSTDVTDMLFSARIYSSQTGVDETAIELSDKYRYRMLLEIFDQELDAAEPAPDPLPPPAAGLIVPTTDQIEDTLFDYYLPTLTADDFAAADVEAVSDAFLDYWLTRLAGLNFISDTFDV